MTVEMTMQTTAGATPAVTETMTEDDRTLFESLFDGLLGTFGFGADQTWGDRARHWGFWALVLATGYGGFLLFDYGVGVGGALVSGAVDATFGYMDRFVPVAADLVGDLNPLNLAGDLAGDLAEVLD